MATTNFSDDTVLLESLKQHNPDAYEFLYNTSKKHLFVLAFSILKREEAARDLLQDFFTDFWEFRLYQNVTRSIHSYLYFAVRNRAFNYKKNEQSFNQFIDHFTTRQDAQQPHYFENEELKRELERAVNKLPLMASKTFKMHYLENLSHTEIAESLGVTKRTVGNHIHRALTALRKELKKRL